ncbi:MAG: DUF6115 domain-containing protein [Muribaculum sp.]|nr:DUF6115 domain-containing protein [Muribaculum sp.]
MGGLEIVLLLAGGILAVLSFVLPVEKEAVQEDARALAKDEIKTLVEQQMNDIRQHVADVVGEAVTYAVEKTERSLERLTNEKIMAINEYSDTVLAEIHKNHEEVVFLYDMLNNKHTGLKNMMSELTQTMQEAESAKQEAESLADSLEQAKQEAESLIDSLEQLEQKNRDMERAVIGNVSFRRLAPIGVEKIVEPREPADSPEQRMGLPVGQAVVNMPPVQSMQTVPGLQQTVLDLQQPVPDVADVPPVQDMAAGPGLQQSVSDLKQPAQDMTAGQSMQPVPGLQQSVSDLQQFVPDQQQPAQDMAAGQRMQPVPNQQQPAQDMAAGSGMQPVPGLQQPVPDLQQTVLNLQQFVPGLQQSMQDLQQPVMDVAHVPPVQNMQPVLEIPPIQTGNAGKTANAGSANGSYAGNIAGNPAAQSPLMDLQFMAGGAESNNNERILKLYQQGKSKVAIAKELGLGVGEVKLVIDLYKSL